MMNIYLPLNRGHVKTPPVAGISGKTFIFETTITAHLRILPNHILHTVLSQSTFILRLREGSDDKEQRMLGDRGGMMKNGEKTKHVVAVFPLPKQTSASKTQEVFVCLSAFNRISAARYLYLGLDVVTQSHCLHRYIAYIDVSHLLSLLPQWQDMYLSVPPQQFSLNGPPDNLLFSSVILV